MTFPAIVPTVSPAASIIFWKQVETSVIEVGFRGEVVASRFLQRTSVTVLSTVSLKDFSSASSVAH